MSTQNTTATIIEIKKNIQSIVSKLMSNSVNTLIDTSIIEQISKYKVATDLVDLSNKFGNVLDSQSPGS